MLVLVAAALYGSALLMAVRAAISTGLLCLALSTGISTTPTGSEHSVVQVAGNAASETLAHASDVHHVT